METVDHAGINTVEVTSETGLIREHIQEVGFIEVRDFIRAA